MRSSEAEMWPWVKTYTPICICNFQVFKSKHMFSFQTVLQHQLNFSLNVSLKVKAVCLVFEVLFVRSFICSFGNLLPLYPTKDRRQTEAYPG